MDEVQDGLTIGAIFAAAVASHGDRPFLAVPPNASRGYLPDGLEITYSEAAERIAELAAIYRAAGYGLGHRVATLLENRPEYVLHKLALNAIGVCCVPINPDYRAGETAYLLEHSKPDLVLTLASREDQLRRGPRAEHATSRRPQSRTTSPRIRSSSRRDRRRADHRPPRPPPASSIPRARPGGRRAASSRTATRSSCGARYAALGGVATLRRGGGAHLQSAAALSRERRRGVLDGRDLDAQLPDPARALPSAALVARDRRQTGRPSSTTSASSHRCCWPSRPARTTAATACASASAPASSRSCMRSSRGASASR